MVSLVELSEVTEEGVTFRSPYDGKEILLTPEQSIAIQNSLGRRNVADHYLSTSLERICLVRTLYSQWTVFLRNVYRFGYYDATG